MYIEPDSLEYEENYERLRHKHLIGPCQDVLEFANGMIRYNMFDVCGSKSILGKNLR